MPADGYARDCKGRKPTVDAAEARRLKVEELRPAEIAARLKVSRSTARRAPKPESEG